MADSLDDNLISSKEILLKTGISRATLNNYIKMGIIPRPLVRKPEGGMGTIKKIGYFPLMVLDRIESVKAMKRSGNSMDEIVNQLRAMPVNGFQPGHPAPVRGKRESGSTGYEMHTRFGEEDLKVSFGDIRMPGYLINFDFQVEWASYEAEQRIFWQPISSIKEKESRNIFKLFFQWELHNHVRNWRDLIAFHMSFAKMKYTRDWMENMYAGISGGEVRILRELYEKVEPKKQQTVEDSIINLLMEDGTTDVYRVYSLFFREGIFFLYANAGSKVG